MERKGERLKNVLQRTLWDVSYPDYSAAELQERYAEIEHKVVEGKLHTMYKTDRTIVIKL